MTILSLRWLTVPLLTLSLLASCAQPVGPVPASDVPPLAQSLVPLGSGLSVLPGLPSELDVPAGQTLVRRVVGAGVQIYDCTLTASGAAWTFRAPEAELYGLTPGDVGRVGRHFAGPTWEDRADGSRVVGRALRSVPAPPSTPAAIPWLLLEARATTSATSGAPGMFTRTTFVRRLYTLGGMAPTAGCEGGTVGRESRIPYAALYEFFAPD
ncbi:DUF3455 domain-containing protein [Deinococcus oregonensis]|uniref:DUF3455 domain-containing protein n=1 Tax=Deinococcus oregonensis TaxID=1805970 RepID=A0ABV6AYE9_9DEIO